MVDEPHRPMRYGLDRSGQDDRRLVRKRALTPNLSFCLCSWPEADVTDIRGPSRPHRDRGLPAVRASPTSSSINDQGVAGRLIFDQPLAPTSPIRRPRRFLGGTEGKRQTATRFSMIARLRFRQRVSAHGGVRLSDARSRRGTFGSLRSYWWLLNGYNAAFDSRRGMGYLAGMASTIGPISPLRVALILFLRGRLRARHFLTDRRGES